MSKRCLWCNKLLKRKTYITKKGWKKLEWIKDFEERKYCDYICGNRYKSEIYCKKWTKKKLRSAFNQIKTEKRFNTKYMLKKHTKLMSAIWRVYGNNPWGKFLRENGWEDKIINNYQNPKHKQILKALIAYMKEENDIKPKQIFTYSPSWGLPIDISIHPLSIYQAIQYGIKIKRLRLVKKGRVVDKTGRRIDQASQYVYLTTKI